MACRNPKCRICLRKKQKEKEKMEQEQELKVQKDRVLKAADQCPDARRLPRSIPRSSQTVTWWPSTCGLGSAHNWTPEWAATNLTKL
jgi:hypothetical protein